MHQNVGEQPRLRRKIGVHIMMMVKMVTGKIGKCRDMDVQTVKPILLKPMAARLQRQMGDASVFKYIEVTVQADRVGCCRERANQLSCP